MILCVAQLRSARTSTIEAPASVPGLRPARTAGMQSRLPTPKRPPSKSGFENLIVGAGNASYTVYRTVAAHG